MPVILARPEDHLGNEIQNFVVHLLASDPGSPAEGQVWINTTSHKLKVHLDGVTKTLLGAGDVVDADVAVGAAIALSKLATNPLARANHTGSQLAATISDFSTAVTAHRLDQMAVPTNPVALNGQRATGAADASGATDLTTLQQVQALIAALNSGQDWKDAVRVAVTTNVDVASPGATLDGVTMAAGDRVLLAGQTTGSQNGVYVWNGASSAMTRPPDADSSAEVTSGMTVPVAEGTRSASQAILTTPDPVVLGTTGLSFTFLANAGAYTGGTGITVTGSVVALTTPVAVANGGTGGASAAAARTALGAASSYDADITGDGAATQFTVNHALGTKKVGVHVYEVTTDDEIGAEVHRTDTNNVRITITPAPANAKVYNVVVFGRP